MPLETFVQVGERSRSNWKAKREIVIHWACPDRGLYIYAWISG